MNIKQLKEKLNKFPEKTEILSYNNETEDYHTIDDINLFKPEDQLTDKELEKLEDEKGNIPDKIINKILFYAQGDLPNIKKNTIVLSGELPE